MRILKRRERRAPLKKLFDFLFRLQPDTRPADYFDQVLTPVYLEAQIVFHDHLATLKELQEAIQASEPVAQVIDRLEQGRNTHLINRIRLRGALATRLGEIHSQRSTFERGLWGLLRGGMATYEDGRVNLEPYAFGNRHTLLDILYHISGTAAIGGPDFSHFDASTCLDMINHQIITIRRAFEDVDRSYAEYKARAKTTPAGGPAAP